MSNKANNSCYQGKCQHFCLVVLVNLLKDTLRSGLPNKDTIPTDEQIVATSNVWLFTGTPKMPFTNDFFFGRNSSATLGSYGELTSDPFLVVCHVIYERPSSKEYRCMNVAIKPKNLNEAIRIHLK